MENGLLIMTAGNMTPEEIEAELGEKIKTMRLTRNLDQITLAARAGVSVRALRNLESGAGSTLKTLASVLKALGRADWLMSIAPVATIDPLTLSRDAQPRQRASHSRIRRIRD